MPIIKSFYSFSEAKNISAELGIKSRREYEKSQLLDEKLPSSPEITYGERGWIDWYDFLGKTRSDYYVLYADAQRSVRQLNIKSGSDYKKKYSQDSRLPPAPHRTYANDGWTNWYDFLGTKKPNLYPTYEEAKAAALAINIKNGTDYEARFTEDERLPANPKLVYKSIGWTGWKDFLDNHKRYASLAEARKAARSLGIKTSKDYRTAHYKDPRLPSAPDQVYGRWGWAGWDVFLGDKKEYRYATYVEAQMAVQELGIKSQPEYSKRYKDDPRLHACPWIKYKDRGWSGWYDFLGTRAPFDARSQFPNIWSEIELWLKSSRGISRKRVAIRMFLGEFYHQQNLPDDPRYLLLRANAFDSSAYQRLIESQNESMRAPYHRDISSFYAWLLEEYCTDIDADERIVIPGFRNPFVTVLAGYSDSLGNYRPSQSTKVPLGYEYILRARQYLVPNGEQVMLTRPSLADLPHLQVHFDNRADWLTVDESLIDEDDPNCILRKHERSGKAATNQIWSPVRFIAMYVLLRYPLRGQQILWLDSGEADEEVPILDAENGGVRWVRNDHPIVDLGGKKRWPQGAIQKSIGGAFKIYVTTNKTGRGADRGYDVEWVPDDIVYWLLLLREWQAKYNPISKPTSWSSIGLDRNEKILKARGAQCFLFRVGSGKPMLTSTAFLFTLPGLLYSIQRDGENLAFKDSEGRKRMPYVSPYTPHSLRVSLITAYIIDGGAPISVISKLVGHSSLVMTIYYTKLTSDQMRKVMGEAEKRAEQLVLEQCKSKIRSHGLAPLRGQLIATDGNRHLLEADVPNSACMVFDCGICPMSASACDEGGVLILEKINPAQNRYAPVEAGYLGKKNCTRCRFFITGVPFLGGLVALANEVALEIHIESQRYEEFTVEVEQLEQDFYDACQENRPDTQQSKRKSAVAFQQQSAGKLDGLLNDYASVNRYVVDCIKLINQGESDDESGVRLVVASDPQELAVAYEESESQYHLLAEICQNASIYHSSNPSRAVPLIAEAIDRMAQNNGLAPSMFRLTPEQKLVVAKELNTLLLQRLGSWERIDELFSGDLMLLDIDAHEPELTSISSEIRQILSPPNGVRQISRKDKDNE